MSPKDMQGLAKQIHNSLIKNHKTLSVAESCTGGLISKILTDLPQSSRYFIAGITAYNNSAKTGMLKVPAKLIAEKGAVSCQVARKMAQSCRRIARTDISIAVTGIAGPSGAIPHKPIGTVFIAVSKGSRTACKRFLFGGSRASIRKQTALEALKLLRSAL